MNYYFSIRGKLPPTETAVRKSCETVSTSALRKSILAPCLFGIIVCMLAANPLHAEGSAGQVFIPDGLPLYVAGMFAVVAIPETDKQSHYYIGFMLGSFGTLIGDQNPYVGFGLGCGAGVLKEIFDHQQEGNKFDSEDMAYTCLGAGIAAYSVNSIIKFYKIRDAKMIGVQKRF